MKKLLLVLLAFAGLAMADVTGTWTGPMTMKNGDETRDDTAYLVLKQDGGKITGTIGPNEERRYDITTGTAEGDNIYIEAVVQGDAALVLKLKLEGGKLVGDLSTKGAGAPPISGRMTLEKKK
jgi:hypothetical protein